MQYLHRTFACLDHDDHTAYYTYMYICTYALLLSPTLETEGAHAPSLCEGVTCLTYHLNSRSHLIHAAYWVVRWFEIYRKDRIQRVNRVR